MAKFTDHTGFDWHLRLTVGDVSDVKRETRVNLGLAAKDAAWVEAVFSDPAKLVEILYVLCEPQCKAAGLSPEDFARRFDGATLEAAGQALAEAVADFFPRSAVAQALRRNLAKVMAAADAKAVAEIERTAEKLTSAKSTASPSPTNSPASAESTPDPSPSAN